MSAIETGGPAFPTGTGVTPYNPGMTLRDYFAAKALAAMLANTNKEGSNCGAGGLSVFPVYAYEWADAMLAARKQPTESKS